MLKSLVRAMAACVAVVCSGAASAQSTIALWNFNSPVPDNNFSTGTISPAQGSGTASSFGGVTTSFASGTASGGSTDPELNDNSAWQTTGYPGSTAGNRTAGVQFAVSTCGYTGVTVTWDTRHSNTSSRFVRVQYTLNVNTATPVWVDGPLFEATFPGEAQGQPAGDRWYNTRTLNLTSVPAVNDNANFAVRMVTEFAPGQTFYRASTATSTYAGTGTLRYDSVLVTGTSLGGCGRPQLGTLQITPSAVCAGETIVLTVPVTPGINPASTGLQVRANLSSLGGSSTQSLFDNGTNGDAVAGDGTYSLSYTIPLGTTPGLNLAVPVTVSDAQSRSSTTSAVINLSDCSGLGSVVISQVYGGGGNNGSVYNYDFVELFNRGASPVNITGWALHYAAANGEFLSFTQLNGTIPSGGYYLIRQDGNSSVGQPLPQPWDAIGIIGINSIAGRLALTTKTVPLTNCFDSIVSDLMAYGNTTTGCYEGNGPVAALDNANAAIRSNNGCIDTNDNAADFYRGTPTPRNSASAPFFCVGTAPTGVGAFAPNAQCAGSTVNFDVTVTPGTGPASTGLSVTADLSSIGGSANTVLSNVGGNVFRASVLLPPTLTPGGRSVFFVVRDSQNRNTGGAASLIVQQCNNLATAITDPAAVCSNLCGTLRVVVFVTPADSPAPGALTVTADLSALGGSATQALYDDGTNGDTVAFDNVFAFEIPYAQGLTPGTILIPYQVVDDLARVTTGNATLAVRAGCEDLIENVSISQIYGGGGNTGSTWRSDYVELKNTGETAVDVTGWSVQYASRAGNFTQKVDLTGSIPANGYYLVRLSLSAAGADLPTPDATGSDFGIDNTDGKLALVSSTTLLGAACSGPTVVDFVGYGDEASCFRGGAPATQPSNTLAIYRLQNGCQDTFNNDADFKTGVPQPRNSLSAPEPCVPLVCEQPCLADYNADTFLNLDDLGDFITDFYTSPPIPGGLQPEAPTYADLSLGYGVPCPAAPNAPAPYAANAYQANGYRVGYSSDGSNSCPLDPSQPFPNLDNLNDYITYYYTLFGSPECSN